MSGHSQRLCVLDEAANAHSPRLMVYERNDINATYWGAEIELQLCGHRGLGAAMHVLKGMVQSGAM